MCITEEIICCLAPRFKPVLGLNLRALTLLADTLQLRLLLGHKILITQFTKFLLAIIDFHKIKYDTSYR